MEALDNTWSGSWRPLINLTYKFQACHLCTFNVAAIFFRGHPYILRTLLWVPTYTTQQPRAHVLYTNSEKVAMTHSPPTFWLLKYFLLFYHIWQYANRPLLIYEVKPVCFHRIPIFDVCLLTLGAHAQRGLQYFVCLSVCLCVCLSVCMSVTTSLAHLAAKSLKFGRR